MKALRLAIPVLLAMAVPLFAQGPPIPPPPPDGGSFHVETGPGGAMGGGITIRREMGEWWKNSEITKKLQLSGAQITKLNQIFYDHRLKLIDYRASMEKEDLHLQNLLDQDQPDENQVSTQVDQVLAARGKLEREFTMMNLDLRRVLSVEQWRQLKAIQEQRGPDDRIFLYRKMGPNTFYKKLGPEPDAAPALSVPDDPGGGL
ncbi:MAG TPA: periplasmic heavy metal sensor [Terriglobales bacterium]|nr:periplasmic heavy metal sensor [Terriglobales bacterium]